MASNAAHSVDKGKKRKLEAEEDEISLEAVQRQIKAKAAQTRSTMPVPPLNAPQLEGMYFVRGHYRQLPTRKEKMADDGHEGGTAGASNASASSKKRKVAGEAVAKPAKKRNLSKGGEMPLSSG